ncbi:MAG TPA: hypothetical protein PLN52_13935 [Opitutaceae bacterium]|nr:hypothetical protein [Opitutaceae bacterium]
MSSALVTYLHDHLSAATAAKEILKSLIENAPDPTLADYASALLSEIVEEGKSVEEIKRELGGSSGVIKHAASLVTAQLAKAKLHNMKSPLGIFEAIEALMLGVTGKRALWIILEQLSRTDARLHGHDYARFIKRSTEQILELEEKRVTAAFLAFTTT